MPETPPFPHIECPAGSPIAVHFGWIGKMFLVFICSTFGTVAWLSYAQVTSDDIHIESDNRDVQIEENVAKMDRNMRKLDEGQRIQAAQTALTVKQLNKLLEIQGVTERIEAPPVKPSELEDLR